MAFSLSQNLANGSIDSKIAHTSVEKELNIRPALES